MWTMHSKLHFQVQVCALYFYRGLSFRFSNAALTCRDGRVPPLGERNA